MGSSLVLQGGAAVTKTLKEAVAQTGHGFSVGSVVRWDYANNKYILALADTAENAEVAGVINQVDDSDNFQITYNGYIEVPSLSGISAPVLFLSGVSGGKLSDSPPSTIGSVVKPVLTRNTNGSGHLVMNYLGTQIGGSSTVAIDEIQPVGTIMPFAGNAIPDTWLECNGASYSVSSYPELYAKLQNSSGAAVPAYGYIATLTGPGAGTANFALGDMVQFKTTAGTFSGGLYDSNADIIGIIISISGTVPITASGTITVQILPNYNSNTKSFQFPNAIFTAGIGTPTSTGSGNYRVLTTPASTVNPSNGGWRGGNANLTVSAVAITHFNTPDLRGRFAIGTNTSPLGELESDVTNISAISGIYSLGSEGGEEAHTLTTAEMPQHNHNASSANAGSHTHSGSAQTGGSHSHTTTLDMQGNGGQAPFSGVALGDKFDTTAQTYTSDTHSGHTHTLSIDASGTHTHTITVDNAGSNTSHNNMPPYLAVRYIIKAKPYTRAAIVDGIDLPYNSLLVRDLRTRNVGGSNGDLVFYTNTVGDGGNGTERMRIEVGGEVGIGTNAPSQKLHVYDGALRVDLLSGTNSAILAGPGSNLQIKHTSGNSNLTMYNSSSGGFIFSTFQSGTEGERIRIAGDGSLGIGISTPGASLDVNGTLKVGNFGGATNVMVKPSNTTPGAVGYVQPIFFAYSGSGSGGSRGIPAGTWFVYGQWIENSNTSYDNDPTHFMAKVWTVPTGKYLHIATDDQLWTGTDAGNGGKINLHWKLSDNATETISGAVSTWGTGWNTFVIPPISNPSATTVGSDAVTAMPYYVYGYAEYDTHGVRGSPNNTPLGPGYGYIQRLS